MVISENIRNAENNVFHTTDSIKKPLLFLLLLEANAYFIDNNKSAQIDTDFNADELLNASSNLTEADNYDHVGLLELLYTVKSQYDVYNSVGAETLQTYIFLLEYKNKKDAFDSFMSKTNVAFSEDIDSEFLIADNLVQFLLSRQFSLNEMELAKVISVIDGLSDDHILFSYKQTFIDEIKDKEVSTTPDIALMVMNALMGESKKLQTDMMDDMFVLSGMLHDNLNNTGETPLYNALSTYNDTVVLEGNAETYKTSALVVASIAVTIQNLNVSGDYKNLRSSSIYQIDQIKKNDALFRNINALNTLEAQDKILNQSIIPNEQIINNDRATILVSSDNLEQETIITKNDIQTTIDNDKIPTYYNTPIDEGAYYDEGSKIESSASNLNTVTKQTTSDVTKKVSITAAIGGIIKNLDSSHEYSSKTINKLASQTADQMNYSADAMDSLSTEDSDNLLKAIAVVGVGLSVISLLNNPDSTIKSLFNVLSAPIEAAMLLLNGLICAIKQIICLIASVLKGIIGFIEKIGNKLSEFEKANTLQDIQDYWNGVADKANKASDEYIEALKNAVRLIANKNKSIIVTKLHEAGHYEEEWQTAYDKSVEDTLDEIYPDLADVIGRAFTREFGLAMDSLQASVKHSADLFLSIADVTKCDLPIGDIFNVDIKFPYISLDDLAIKIPAVDSKVVKC